MSGGVKGGDLDWESDAEVLVLLHNEVRDFAEACRPDERKTARVEFVLREVQRCDILPSCCSFSLQVLVQALPTSPLNDIALPLQSFRARVTTSPCLLATSCKTTDPYAVELCPAQYPHPMHLPQSWTLARGSISSRCAPLTVPVMMQMRSNAGVRCAGTHLRFSSSGYGHAQQV